MILKCWYTATQCLPPGGRGTAKRWMRNGDTLPFAMQSIQTVQPFPMYLFHEMHTDSEQIAVPHPPPCGGTFPPGEGIARQSSQPFQTSPKGIPHLISYLSYLISSFRPIRKRPKCDFPQPSRFIGPNRCYNCLENKPIPFLCHCEPVRRLVWQSHPPGFLPE